MHTCRRPATSRTRARVTADTEPHHRLARTVHRRGDQHLEAFEQYVLPYEFVVVHALDVDADGSVQPGSAGHDGASHPMCHSEGVFRLTVWSRIHPHGRDGSPWELAKPRSSRPGCCRWFPRLESIACRLGGGPAQQPVSERPPCAPYHDPTVGRRADQLHAQRDWRPVVRSLTNLDLAVYKAQGAGIDRDAWLGDQRQLLASRVHVDPQRVLCDHCASEVERH